MVSEGSFILGEVFSMLIQRTSCLTARTFVAVMFMLSLCTRLPYRGQCPESYREILRKLVARATHMTPNMSIAINTYILDTVKNF